jgi:hypothetical protein
LVRRTFPGGYVAVQFSAAFHDERTLADIARELDLAAASSGWGIALFRAGAAFAHDDLSPYLTRPCLRPSSMLCTDRSDGIGLRQGLVRKIRGAPGAWQGLRPAPR